MTYKLELPPRRDPDRGMADGAVGCPTCLSVVGERFPLWQDSCRYALANLHAAHRLAESLLPAAKALSAGLREAESPIRWAAMRNQPLSLMPQVGSGDDLHEMTSPDQRGGE